MRIVLTVNFSPWSAYSGGGQRSTHELASALAARGHDVTVVYTRPPWERIDVPESVPYRVRWAAFVGSRSRSGAPLRSLNALSVALAVRELLGEADEASVVHSQGEEGAAVPRLRSRPCFGFVVTPRYPSYPDRMLADPHTAFGRLRRTLVPPKYLVLGGALRGADRWCPTSRSSADTVRAAYGLSEDRCTVVPNGVATPFLEVERQPGATDGPIVFFGRLSPAKGARTLVEALAKLDGEAPLATIVGRGPESDLLRRMVDELGLGDRVRFAGWRSPAQLAELLATASMAVLPSHVVGPTDDHTAIGDAIPADLIASLGSLDTIMGEVDR